MLEDLFLAALNLYNKTDLRQTRGGNAVKLICTR